MDQSKKEETAMILSTPLDEVLFWQEIDRVTAKIQELTEKFYPNDPDQYFAEKARFYQEAIGSKEEFCRRLALYRDQGSAKWIASRTGCMDDLSAAGLQKAYQNATREEAAARVVRMAAWRERQAGQLDHYTAAIFNQPSNQILELTIGAGGGTHVLMEKMGQEDSYIGIDIDFKCAKTADGMGKYYGVNALGMCCNLWELPFENGIFSAVCSRGGLEECREIPTILREAARVLRPGGRIVLLCQASGYLQVLHQRLFDRFGFQRPEAEDWLRDVRLFSNLEQLDEIAANLELTRTSVQSFDGDRFVVVYTK